MRETRGAGAWAGPRDEDRGVRSEPSAVSGVSLLQPRQQQQALVKKNSSRPSSTREATMMGRKLLTFIAALARPVLLFLPMNLRLRGLCYFWWQRGTTGATVILAFFSLIFFAKINIIIILFVFDKYYLIIH